jgi:hypothetical protein
MANYQSRYTGPEIDERLRKAGEAVLTEAQTLTDAQKLQARSNIGAGTYSKPSSGIPASDLAEGVIPDVSQFITDDDLSAALEAKQDTISDLADIRSGSQDNVKYTQQTLTNAQKEQARSNIGAGTYDKPDGGIPESDLAQAVKDKLNAAEIYPVTYGTTTQTQIAAAVAAGKLPVCKYGDNVYVYAGESSAGYSQFTSILYNTAARIYVKDSTWGNGNFEIYSKPSGGIPKIDLASGVQSSLAKADTALQEHQDISGKADKVSGATSGDFAGLDSNGNLTDSGKKLSDIAPRIYMGTCSTAAATVAKEATVETFPLDTNNKPLVGTVVGIKFTNTNSATAPTLNVNSTGAASIWYNNAAYEGKGAYGGSASRYIYYVWDGTYWAFQGWSYDADADTNTIGYNLRTNGGTAVAAATFYRYRLLFTAPDGQSLVPSNTSSSTSTTAAKTVNQAKIDPFAPIWYYSTTTAVAAGASVSASYLWMQYSAIPLGYAFNRTGAALTMTARYPVYLKCAPQSDGSAIMDADTPIVQALPSTEDGKIYIFLGYAESEVNITLYYWHPVYYYKDGAIRQWTNAAATSNGVQDVTVGGTSVVSDGVAEIPAIPEEIDTVNVTVDNATGTPSASGSVSGGVLSLAFHNLKGETGPQGPQGNPGSSQDYPFTLANNLTTDDSTVALTAAMGALLDRKISGAGTYQQAVVRAQTVTGIFMWMLQQSAENSMIVKPIWHIGNGVFIDAAGAVVEFEVVTPAEPTFSPDGGAVAEGTVVALSCETQGADIYVSTDGGTTYTKTNTVTISEAVTLKAYSELEGITSEVVSKQFTIVVDHNFKFTVKLDQDNATVYVPVVAGKSYNMTVDWGDGSAVQTYAQTGANKGLSHAYTGETGDTFQITLRGSAIPFLSFYQQTRFTLAQLYSIDNNTLDTTTQIGDGTGAGFSLKQCSNLVSVCENANSSYPSATSFNFESCSALTSLPVAFLTNFGTITSFTFNKCTVLSLSSEFMTAFAAKLGTMTSFYYAFGQCQGSIPIPDNFFNNLTDGTVTDVRQMTGGTVPSPASGVTGDAKKLYDVLSVKAVSGITNINGCFSGPNLTNRNQVPTAWGGTMS